MIEFNVFTNKNGFLMHKNPFSLDRI